MITDLLLLLLLSTSERGIAKAVVSLDRRPVIGRRKERGRIATPIS